MSNKTSDKNVSNIEIVIEDCREHLKLYGEAFITANELDRIEYILSDYIRQKQINEEHRKINGELREKVKELDTKNDELLKDLYSANCIIADLTDSIPKQKVKDKIEELKIQGNYKTLDNPEGRIHFLKEESDYKIEVCEELLQESEDK